MPKPTILDSGPPLTESQLTRLEDVLTKRLPADYRDFLFHHNGGRPVPESFGEPEGLRSMVLVFLSIGASEKIYDLASQYKKTRRDMPAEILPIAFDVCGNKLCLAFKGTNRGKVYFWDHEGASELVDPRIEFPWLELSDDYVFKGDDWPGYPDLTLIAGSFTEFLDSFHDPELDEPKVRRKRPK